MARIISAFVQSAPGWQSDVRRFGRGYRNGKRPDLTRDSEVEACRQAAETARHLGVLVGVVTTVREAPAQDRSA